MITEEERKAIIEEATKVYKKELETLKTENEAKLKALKDQNKIDIEEAKKVAFENALNKGSEMKKEEVSEEDKIVTFKDIYGGLKE